MTKNKQHDKSHATIIAGLASLVVAIFLFVIYKVVRKDNT